MLLYYTKSLYLNVLIYIDGYISVDINIIGIDIYLIVLSLLKWIDDDPV